MMTREERILWAHSHAIEDRAYRVEENGEQATDLRRIALNLGQLAIVLHSEEQKETSK